MKIKRIHKDLCFILIAILAVFINRQIMLLCHEWTHGFVASLFHLKNSPFDLHYGDWALFNVHEDVDYVSLFHSGQGSIAAACIGISALITNTILYFISIKTRKCPFMFYHCLELKSSNGFIHFLLLHLVLYLWFGETVHYFYKPSYWTIIPPVLGIISFIVFNPPQRKVKEKLT